ncbi:hypothetical protein HK098_002749 [Nowakowskiella sp. JEL0407]|nr:hypothetical protein HK098_002749 [Nowakowskiella sp. JEL0407]
MGHGHHGKYPALLIDPAIEKWAHMKESTTHHYKINNRTLKITFTFLVAIPAFLYWGAAAYKDKFAFQGVTNGESSLLERQ